jgi:glycosyltransferase involved in cell wall biosynthesis
MKILHVHSYHVGRGGLEVIYESTTRLLRQRGHEVIELSRDNADVKSPLDRLAALGGSIYSLSAKTEARKLVAEHSPDIAYVHNLYPMLSTSVLDACQDAGVPVVMNVQDYKLTCPMGQHLRNGAICTKCLDGSVAWSAVHACKGGHVTSAAYALSHGLARLRRGYERGVDLFVTPTQFAADHLARAGFDRSRIVVTPNMCDLPEGDAIGDGEYAAYVGRLSPEKGLDVLIDAAKENGVPVRIAGSGSRPFRATPETVRFVGPVSREALPEFYQRARFVVVPSIWFEVFGLVVVEAMFQSVPVIASNIGGLPELVEHEHNGLLVPPGYVKGLADAMRRLWAEPELCRRMGRAGRQNAVKKYGPDAFYRRLMAAFGRVGAGAWKMMSSETEVDASGIDPPEAEHGGAML